MPSTSEANAADPVHRPWKRPAHRRGHAFISFATRQKEHARQIRGELRRAGIEVWWSEDIQCAGEWHGEIDRMLRDAACVVVVWSAESVTSPWVKHEASQALALGSYTPIRIDGVVIPPPFNREQATDVQFEGSAADPRLKENEPGLERLLERVRRLLPTRFERAMAATRRSVAGMVVAASAAALGALALLNSSILTQLHMANAQLSRTEESLQKVNGLANDTVDALSSLQSDMRAQIGDLKTGTAGLVVATNVLRDSLDSAIQKTQKTLVATVSNTAAEERARQEAAARTYIDDLAQARTSLDRSTRRISYPVAGLTVTARMKWALPAGEATNASGSSNDGQEPRLGASATSARDTTTGWLVERIEGLLHPYDVEAVVLPCRLDTGKDFEWTELWWRLEYDYKLPPIPHLRVRSGSDLGVSEDSISFDPRSRTVLFDVTLDAIVPVESGSDSLLDYDRGSIVLMLASETFVLERGQLDVVTLSGVQSVPINLTVGRGGQMKYRELSENDLGLPSHRSGDNLVHTDGADLSVHFEGRLCE